ncbi:hypothetical protein BN77_p11547 [Rhizobium mesoamericanum STM3625]|uniref:Uncharacterized protein n=1 Tax=Rhizobium mesoamericanum STM3625 TaxID=1211777 RepID=K0Q3D9_9HYPH|nr:hypothetical protein BN77_p11547 [Rhizobium mesoamericanum STM3625]
MEASILMDDRRLLLCDKKAMRDRGALLIGGAEKHPLNLNRIMPAEGVARAPCLLGGPCVFPPRSKGARCEIKPHLERCSANCARNRRSSIASPTSSP